MLTWTILAMCHTSTRCIAEVRKKNDWSSIKHVLLWVFQSKETNTGIECGTELQRLKKAAARKKTYKDRTNSERPWQEDYHLSYCALGQGNRLADFSQVNDFVTSNFHLHLIYQAEISGVLTKCSFYSSVYFFQHIFNTTSRSHLTQSSQIEMLKPDYPFRLYLAKVEQECFLENYLAHFSLAEESG